MKRCPECRRDYHDDSLLYCLDDGTALLEGPAIGSESRTVMLPTAEEPTRQMSPNSLPDLVGPTAEMPRDASGSRKSYWALGLVLILAIGGALLAAYRPWNRPLPVNRALQIERLTTNGRSTSAAISPDGKYVIYGVDEGSGDSLWLRQVATPSNIQIFPAAEDVYYWGLTFTPDSNYVNFVRAEFEKNIGWGLNQMPVIGGSQKRLGSGIEGPISYSPDGTQYAFIRDEHPTADETAVMIASADGSGERVISSRKRPLTFPARQIGPAWAPDGKTIACIIADESKLVGEMAVVEVRVDDGSIKPIKTLEWNFISQIAWLRDKSGLLVLGSAKSASSSFARQVWYFSYPEGEARRITTDLNDYQSISLTADTATLVAVQLTAISNIWTVPNGDTTRAEQIRAGGNNEDGMAGLTLAPDGRIVFYSRIGGGDDIWVMGHDGSSPRQLTSGPGANFDMSVSPDGRFVVYVSERAGNVNIWRVPLEGGEPVQITSGNTDHSPVVTPDSQSVIYVSLASGRPNLWKVSIEGGAPRQLTDRSVTSPQISHDGKWISSSFRYDENSTWRYAILSIDGGEPVKVFDLLGKKGNFRWANDGKSLYYLRDTKGGVTNIWSFPVDGGEPKQVTDFKTERIHDYAWSADGKRLVLARGTATSDVVLIRNF